MLSCGGRRKVTIPEDVLSPRRLAISAPKRSKPAQSRSVSAKTCAAIFPGPLRSKSSIADTIEMVPIRFGVPPSNFSACVENGCS